MGNTIQIKRGTPTEKKLLPGEFGLFQERNEDQELTGKNILYIGVGTDSEQPSENIKQIPFITSDTENNGGIPIQQGGLGRGFESIEDNSILTFEDNAAKIIPPVPGVLYNSEDTSNLQFGILPISYGGTGETSLDGLKQALGVSKIAELTEDVNNLADTKVDKAIELTGTLGAVQDFNKILTSGFYHCFGNFSNGIVNSAYAIDAQLLVNKVGNRCIQMLFNFTTEILQTTVMGDIYVRSGYEADADGNLTWTPWDCLGKKHKAFSFQLNNSPKPIELIEQNSGLPYTFSGWQHIDENYYGTIATRLPEFGIEANSTLIVTGAPSTLETWRNLGIFAIDQSQGEIRFCAMSNPMDNKFGPGTVFANVLVLR